MCEFMLQTAAVARTIRLAIAMELLGFMYNFQALMLASRAGLSVNEVPLLSSLAREDKLIPFLC
jgi:hypothetical protein